MFSANLNPALREFGSSGLARLGRVQEALGRIDGNLSLRQGALAKHGGGPGGWASVKASRDSLKQQQRAQLSKFRQKLNQSELRYEQYPPDFHPSFGSGPQTGWGPAFADYPKFPRDKKYNLDANLKPALRELAARFERVMELARGDYAIPALMKLYPKKSIGKAAADIGGSFANPGSLLPAGAAENDAMFALRGLVHPRYADPGNTANPFRQFPQHGGEAKQAIRNRVAWDLKNARGYQRALNAARAERRASKL